MRCNERAGIVAAMRDREALRAEALRVHARYVIEIVEALGLCPWAREAREQGRVCSQVLLHDEQAVEQVVATIGELQADPQIEIGLLIFPQLPLGRIEMQHFAAEIRAQYDRYRGETRAEGPFAIADFHPDAEPDLRSPDSLLPFIRRSPDPTLQLVRRTAIDSVRLGGVPGTRFVDASMLEHGLAALPPAVESLSARVARANLRTVESLGTEHVLALFADIERDRERSYAGFDLVTYAWRKG